MAKRKKKPAVEVVTDGQTEELVVDPNSSETDHVKAFVDHINEKWFMLVKCWRNNTGAMKTRGRLIRFGVPGLGDVIGYMLDGTGRFFNMEVKRPHTAERRGGTLSPEQREILRHMRCARCVAFEARSLEDIDLHMEYLQRTIALTPPQPVHTLEPFQDESLATTPEPTPEPSSEPLPTTLEDPRYSNDDGPVSEPGPTEPVYEELEGRDYFG